MDLFSLVARLALDKEAYDKGLDEAEDAMGGFADKISGGIEAAGKAFAGLATAGAAAVTGISAAVVGGANELAAYGDDIDKNSQKLGISAEAYQEWDAVLQHSGTSIDALKRGMMTLSTSMDDVVAGSKKTVDTAAVEKAKNAYDNAALSVKKAQITYDEAVKKNGASSSQAQKAAIGLQQAQNKAAQAQKEYAKAAEGSTPQISESAQAIQNLGVKVTDASGQMRSQEDVFEDVITALQGMESESQRTTLAQKIFGKGAAELGPLLNTTAEETQAMKDRVHELGGVLSDEAVKASAAYQDAQQDMTTAMDGVKRNAMAEFLPAITSVMEGVTDILAGGDGSGIKNGVEQFVQKLQEQVPKLLKKGKAIVKQIGTAVVENLPEIVSMVASGAIGAAGDIVKTVFTELPALIQSGASWVVQGIQNLFNFLNRGGLKKILLNFQKTFGQQFAKAVAAAVGGGDDVAKRVYKAVQLVIRYVNTGVRIVKDGIQTVWPVIQQVLQLVIQFIGGPVVDALWALWVAVKNGWTDAKPALQAFVDFVSATVLPAIEAALAFVSEHLDTLLPIVAGVVAGIAALGIAQKIIEGVGAFGKLFTAVQGVFNLVKAHPFALLVVAIGALIGWLVHLYQTNEEFRDKVHAAWESIKAFWDSTLKPVFEALKDFVVNTVVPAVVDAWGKFKDKVAEAWEGIKQLWETTLKPAWDALKDWVLTTALPLILDKWSAFKTAISDAWTVLSDLWTNTLEPALSALYDWVMTDALPFILDMWDAFRTAITDAFAAVKEFYDDNVKDVLQALQDWFIDTALPKIIDMAGKFGVGVRNAFYNVKRFYDDYIEGPLSDIKDWFVTSALPDIIDMAGKFADTVGDAFDWVKGRVEDLIDAAQRLAQKLDIVGRAKSLLGISDSAPLTRGGGAGRDKSKIKRNASAAKGGRIFDTPTIVGWADGAWQLAGDAAEPEAVVGVNSLRGMIAEAVRSAGNQTVVVPRASTGGDITVILELDGMQFGRAVYRYGREETQRVGVKLAQGVT